MFGEDAEILDLAVSRTSHHSRPAPVQSSLPMIIIEFLSSAHRLDANHSKSLSGNHYAIYEYSQSIVTSIILRLNNRRDIQTEGRQHSLVISLRMMPRPTFHCRQLFQTGILT